MQAKARVVELRDGTARLSCDDGGTCGTCGSGRGCALRWFGRSAARTLDVAETADDSTPLRPGQSVTLVVDDGELLRAAAIVYLSPLVGLFGGALLARGVAAASEGGVALAALAGALAGGWLARIWSRGRRPRIEVRGAEGSAQ